MPYYMELQGGEFCVFKEGQDAPLECYEDEAQAEAYLTALNIATADETKAESDTHIPPEAVAENARRALEVRAEKTPSERGMTPIGLARARQLANRQPVSVATLRRMVSYFERHEVDKEGATWSEQGKGWQAWQGWGGDEGWAWARRIVEKEDSMNEETKASRRHSAADMKLIRMTRKALSAGMAYLQELGDDGMDDDTETKAMVMEGYNERQEEMIASFEAYAEYMGKWSKGISADGAHYMEENPFADKGIACQYCAFWQEGGMCSIVEGMIAPEAVCKLWVIPESVIAMHAMEPENGEAESEDESAVEVEIEVASTKALDTALTMEVGADVREYARRLMGRKELGS